MSIFLIYFSNHIFFFYITQKIILSIYKIYVFQLFLYMVLTISIY